MKVGLDTSFILRLLTKDPPDQAQVAFQYFLGLKQAQSQILISDLVVSEAYFALQHHYQVPKREILSQLQQLLSSEGIKAESAPAVLKLENLESAKPGFVDRMIHEQYLQEADTIVTFEKAARKLPKTHILAA
jgi:predicted nucleic-acid-binding protein